MVNIKLIDVIPSTRANKKLMAIFEVNYNTLIKVHFGSKFSKTFIDHNDITKKANYIKRHKALGTEDYTDVFTPASLSMFLLWNKPTLEESLEDFKERFNV
jgi:hypothetical protein